MKKYGYLAAMAIGLAFASCNQGNKDSKELADSLNETKDTTTNTAETGGISVVGDDAQFAVKAAAGGLAEVQLSKLALTKSQNAEVKTFAEMMIKDHEKANANLAEIASQKNITIPTSLDSDHQKVWDDLNATSGSKFDKLYVDAMLDGHEKTVDLLEKGEKDLKDAELKTFATSTLPTVKSHLAHIKKIKASLK